MFSFTILIMYSYNILKHTYRIYIAGIICINPLSCVRNIINIIILI